MTDVRAKIFIIIFFCFLMNSCATTGQSPTRNSDLTTLSDWMTGSFSSQEQAMADQSFYDIRLQMVRIWKERSDGIWLYIEQAVAGTENKPYRQRVYHLTTPGDGTFQSKVYTIPEPLSYAGAWRERKPLSSLVPDQLMERKGCALILRRSEDGSSFAGSTQGKECESELRGATYATSEAKITTNELYSWDRGFNDRDIQVWGAEKGGYHFKKIENY